MAKRKLIMLNGFEYYWNSETKGLYLSEDSTEPIDLKHLTGNELKQLNDQLKYPRD